MKKFKGLNGNTWWVSIVVAIMFQTGAAVWWAASMSTEVKSLRTDLLGVVKEIKETRYQDITRMDKTIAVDSERIASLEAKRRK